jgi:hypothetical protein
MVIYYTHSYSNKRGESHRLLQCAIACYLKENGYSEDDAAAESKTLTASLCTEGEYGKPVIPGFAPFSISHSNNTWAVLIAESDDGAQRCGLDVQYRRKTEAVSVAKRFYAAEDAEMVCAAVTAGADAAEDVFFCLWTRREALVKAAGESVAATDFPAVNGDAAVFRDTEYIIADVRIPGAGLYAAACCDGTQMPVRTSEL